MIKKKLISLIVLTLLIFIIILIINHSIEYTITDYIKLKMYGEPINTTTGEINNKYFGISKDGKNSAETTKGINRAIKYAYKNNISYIKFEEGYYSIKIDSNQKGITIYSNLKIDLNSSSIRVEGNSYTSYRLFYLKNESNVEIFNGTLIGDKDTHDYETIQSEHQWGYAIHIRGSQNIQVYNLDIYNFTGDGIYIDKYKTENYSEVSENIKIYNNNIHNCRRQGISIIDGNKIEIYNNEIHDILGSSPQTGIDLEANEQDEKIQNIRIYGNKFYNFKRNFAIQIYEGVHNVEIFENDINSTIRINDAKEEVKIYNNNLKNGEILAYLTDINIEKLNILNKIIITNNQMEKYNINIENVEIIEIQDNNIKNGNIIIKSSNARIFNNNIEIQNNLEFVYYYTVKEENNKYYTIEIDNPIPTGNYKNIEKIHQSEYLIIKRKEL